MHFHYSLGSVQVGCDRISFRQSISNNQNITIFSFVILEKKTFQEAVTFNPFELKIQESGLVQNKT